MRPTSSSSGGGDAPATMRTPTRSAASSTGGLGSSVLLSPTRSLLSPLPPPRKSPSSYNATSMVYSPYKLSAVDRALLATDPSFKKSSGAKRRPRVVAEPPPDTRESDAQALAARHRQLAHQTMSGATRASDYMAKLMASVDAVDVTAARPVVIAEPPLMNLEALLQQLTPAQALQLHKYPQLLVQAAAAAAAQAQRMGPDDGVPSQQQLAVLASMTSTTNSFYPGHTFSSQTSSVEEPPPLPVHVRTPFREKLLRGDLVSVAYAHRTTSGLGWDESFMNAPPLCLANLRETGTFGVPPILAFPGSPGAKKPKLTPWIKAQREEEWRKQRDHSPSPPRTATNKSTLSSPMHQMHAPPLSPLRANYFSPNNTNTTPLPQPHHHFFPPSTQFQQQEEKSQHLTSPPSTAPLAGPRPFHARSMTSLGGAAYVPSDLAQRLFDLADHFADERPEHREQLLAVRSIASSALAGMGRTLEDRPTQGQDLETLAEDEEVDQIAAHTPQWTMAPHIDRALRPFLGYFSGAREKYHLQPSTDGGRANSTHAPLYTSSSSALSIAEYGLLQEAFTDLPPSDSAEEVMVADTLRVNGWIRSGLPAKENDRLLNLAGLVPDPSIGVHGGDFAPAQPPPQASFVRPVHHDSHHEASSIPNSSAVSRMTSPHSGSEPYSDAFGSLLHSASATAHVATSALQASSIREDREEAPFRVVAPADRDVKARLDRAATRIQSLFRGSRVRKRTLLAKRPAP